MKRGPEENNEKTHIETGEGRARPLVIESLLFSDFRNYDRFSLDEPGNLVVFTGKNAVGKTNILEGIQLLTSATSFRHPQVMQLVREGCASSRIMMRAGDGNRMLEVALGLEPGKRRYTVNGKTKAAADVAACGGYLPGDLDALFVRLENGLAPTGENKPLLGQRPAEGLAVSALPGNPGGNLTCLDGKLGLRAGKLPDDRAV